MKKLTHFICLTASLALGACGSSDKGSTERPIAQLQEIAHFDHQVTGVTVSKDGRMFVNFPRWSEDAPVSVAELQGDGTISAYPSQAWNSWRESKKLSPRNHFICVQSVVADGKGNLWVLDAAVPNMKHMVAGGPKLVKIDLASNQVTQIVFFRPGVAPKGTYLNDVRFSPDGVHAYITDSGKGAIIVVDLDAGTSWRTLDGLASTKPEPGVEPMADGQVLRKLDDGSTLQVASDGIALSPAGDYLYWQALTGKVLYRIPVQALNNPRLSDKVRESEIEQVTKTNVADGLWMSDDGIMYVTDPAHNAVKALHANGKMTTLVRDPKLRWPDTMSQGPDGTLFVTSSHIQDSPWFKADAGQQVPTELWRIIPR